MDQIIKMGLGSFDKKLALNDTSYVTEEGIRLVDEVLCSMRVSKHFKDNSDSINSIDFDKNGHFMISASDDDSIILYNCENGSVSRNLKSKKYGASHIRCTHTANTVLHASTKIDDTIRYLSLYDNKYLRYFQGHSDRVTGLSMSPLDDRFLSTSLDNTVRIWDLRSPNCQGLMQLQQKSVASIDPEGLIFAVLMHNNSLKLYDLRSFDKGPFSSFILPPETSNDIGVSRGEWSSLKFSPDGKQILLTKTGSGSIKIIDAFKGEPLHTLVGHKVTQKATTTAEASYTPDSRYVISGSEDGKIFIWNADTGYTVCVLKGAHAMAVNCVQFNPKFMMMASACTDMSFWIPKLASE